MTYEEELDSLLKIFADAGAMVYPDAIKKSSLHDDEAKFWALLNHLMENRYIFLGGQGHTITPNGKYLITNGGYAERKRREDILYANSVQGISIARRNYFWAVVAAVAAIAAVIIGIVQLCKTP